MPVIVDEIVISVEVTNAESGGTSRAEGDERQVLVSECVERVLDILRREEER